MEETRDEWDAHDEDVEMSRSCEHNSSNFFMQMKMAKARKIQLVGQHHASREKTCY
jgi:hypothetical protein